MPEFLNSGATNTPCRLLLAHGAGAAMTSPFLDQLTALLVDRGIAVSRFEFAYMAARRSGGKRRPPPAAEKLTGEYLEAIAAVRRSLAAAQRLFIGGKSMGGRVASLIAQDVYAGGDCRGLVCLGYPFHPPGKPEQLRTAHLESLTCPALIVQGERDPFGVQKRGSRLRAGAVDCRDLDRRRRPRSGSARGLRLHPQGQSCRRSRCRRGLHAVAAAVSPFDAAGRGT